MLLESILLQMRPGGSKTCGRTNAHTHARAAGRTVSFRGHELAPLVADTHLQDYRRLRGDSGNGYSGLNGGFNLGPSAADVNARPTQYTMTSLSANLGRRTSGDIGTGSGRRARHSTMSSQSMQQQSGGDLKRNRTGSTFVRTGSDLVARANSSGDSGSKARASSDSRPDVATTTTTTPVSGGNRRNNVNVLKTIQSSSGPLHNYVNNGEGNNGMLTVDVPPFPSDEERAVAFNYVVSHDVNMFVKVKIRGMMTNETRAYGQAHKAFERVGGQLRNVSHDRMFVSMQYYSDSLPISNNEDIITDLVSPIVYSAGGDDGDFHRDPVVAWTWETWVTLPIKYNELSLTSAIAFTFYNLDGEPY